MSKPGLGGASGGLPVPKLNLQSIKHVKEYRDWYQYALKLEDSVKFLRQRIKQLEHDNSDITTKYREEIKQKD